MEALLWRVTHADYRGKLPDGTKCVLHMSAKTYGTESWPLSTFSDAELIEKLGKRLDREIERLASKCTSIK